MNDANMIKNAIVSWSGGKDGALALYDTLRSGSYKVLALLTTVTRDYDRVSIHGIRRVLLEQQANSLGIPLEKMFISKNASNEEYQNELLKSLKMHQIKGVSEVIYGDIFLEDVRNYRERLLAQVKMTGVYPLWGQDTKEIARRFLSLGFKAVITNVDSRVLSKEFSGREFDARFLSDLPDGVDPCGENGEFHSFVYAGPIFHRKITFIRGDVVLRENRFYYCDLIPT